MEQIMAERKGLMAVIIPAYNEEQCVKGTYERIRSILRAADIKYKLIFIDDGSTDKTFSILQTLCVGSDDIIGIRFSRNFGKESAIYAGISKADEIHSDCAVVIDCDLQHPPEKMVEMYRLWQQGYDVVEGVKSDRGDETAFHKLAAKTFYSLMSEATKIDMQRASDYKLLDQKAVVTLLNMKEKNSFFRALSSWIGYRSTQIEYEVQQREHGQSKWSIKSLIKYAVSNIAAFTSAPMQVVTFLGILMCVIAVVFGAISLTQKIMGKALEGFTTVIILQLLTSSIIMISLGIIGYYISKIYEEVKNRPKYIISEICGNQDDKERL